MESFRSQRSGSDRWFHCYMRETSGKSATVFESNHETKLNPWNTLNARASWIEAGHASKAGSCKAIGFLKFPVLLCHAQKAQCQTQDGIQPLRGAFFGYGLTSTRRSTDLSRKFIRHYSGTENRGNDSLPANFRFENSRSPAHLARAHILLKTKSTCRRIWPDAQKLRVGPVDCAIPARLLDEWLANRWLCCRGTSLAEAAQ